jgi:hypothetical protein
MTENDTANTQEPDDDAAATQEPEGNPEQRRAAEIELLMDDCLAQFPSDEARPGGVEGEDGRVVFAWTSDGKKCEAVLALDWNTRKMALDRCGYLP